MRKSIEKQISAISQAIDWFRKYKTQGEYEQHFVQLVRERSALRKILEAECENPAIAAFGASQVGKSHITSSLLQQDDQEFWINDIQTGRKYNFIRELNPKTNNSEATGVTTRLTSFNRNPDKYNEKYPVMLKLFSVADILSVLTIGYFENITDYNSLKESDVEEFSLKIYDKYKNQEDINNPIVTEDDIFTLQSHLKKHLTGATRFIYESNYFYKLALVIRKIPFMEYAKVFSILWAHNFEVVSLFERLLNMLKTLKFQKQVYVPIEAVKNEIFGENYITLMSVTCLKKLNPAEEPKIQTDVFMANDELLIGIDKSELCAVCAEVVFKIDEIFLTQEKTYCDSMLGNYSKSRLPKSVKTDILAKCDLLDFPGARNSKKFTENDLRDKFENIVELFLRGKVTYLFKKYCDYMAINILLYCHHSAHPEASSLPLLLDDWINEYVGDSPEKRSKTIELLDGKSPFFFISTKFNEVMEFDPDYNDSTLKGKWLELFEKVYYSQCFLRKSWFDNWDKEGVSFKNSYLLRGFKFSSNRGGSNLYAGYNGDQPKETELILDHKYYDDLQESFINHDWVKSFFTDPTLSWDVAATMQNDGSLYLIQQLAAVANKSMDARTSLFKEKLSQIRDRVIGLLKGFYISDDDSEALEENISKASKISFDLDYINRADPYFFGNLIELLQLPEKDVSHMMHKIIQGSELNHVVYGSNDYDAIKITCREKGHDLDKAANDEEKWDCILRSYPHYSTKEQAEQDFEAKGINVADLFKGGEKPRLNSQYIAGQIYTLWETKLQSPKLINDLIGDSKFDSAVLGYITKNLITSFKSLGIDKELSESIAEYVNTPKIESKFERFISALLASTLNRYVLDFGYSVRARDVKSIDKVKGVSKVRQLNLFDRINKPRENKNSDKELTDLLNCIGSQENSFTPSFERNYYSWKDYMFISLISQNEIVDPIDVEANNSIKTIMDFIKE